MSTPSRPRSPRWSVLLRVGVGLTLFGLFVALFAFTAPTFGFVLVGAGVACLLASFVTYLQGRPRRR